MKRVLLALILVLALFSTSIASAAPATPAGEYWEAMKNLYKEWEAMEGESEMELTITLPEEEAKVFNISLKSGGNLEDFTAWMEMVITTEDPELEIPVIHMITQGADMYFNTEIVRFLADMVGMGDSFDVEEEYIMLQSGDDTIDVNSQFLIEVLEMVEKMELDFEFDMVKEDDTYTLNMDSDQIIDLFDAYMKFSFENMNEMMEITGQDQEIEITEEEMQEVIAMYEEVFVPVLEEAKEALKGSYYFQESTITEDRFDEVAELLLKTPFGDMLLTMESFTQRLDEYTVQIPESVRVFTEEELTNLILGGMGLPEMGGNLVAILLVDEDQYVLFTDTEVIEGEVEISISQEGLSYMAAEDMAQLFGVDIEPSTELVHTRVLADHGYEIVWDGQYRMIQVFEVMDQVITEEIEEVE